MLDYRTTQSSRSSQPTGQPDFPRACGRPPGCNEWLTEWWMLPEPPATPSQSAAVIETETAPRDRATTTVDRATGAVDRRTQLVDGATGSVDRRTGPVEPCTTTAHRRTAAFARSEAAQHLRGGLEPSSPKLARDRVRAAKP